MRRIACAALLAAVAAAALAGTPLSRPSDFDWGKCPAGPVRLRGVPMAAVRAGAERTELTLNTSDGAFTASVPGKASAWAALLDGEVELEGVVESPKDRPVRFGGLTMFVADPSDVTVTADPPADPYAVAELRLGEAGPAADAHAVRVRGVVTFADTGRAFVLQTGASAIRAETDRLEPVVPGDRVEAVGFLLPSERGRRFRAVLYRRIGRGDLPSTVDLSAPDFPADVRLGTLDALRVSFEGRFDGSDLSREGMSAIRLVNGGKTALVTFRGRLDARTCEAFAWRPVVRATGVARTDGGRLEIEANGPGDVTVEMDGAAAARARSHTLRWVFAAVGVVALLVLAVLLEASRRRHRVMSSVARERKRMADDLHDTIEQHLAGAGMLLKLARLPANRLAPQVDGPIHEAQDILLRAKQEMRDVVWGLKNDEMMRLSPAEMLRQLAARQTRKGVIRVRTRLKGLPEKLAGAAMRDLSLIVREAIGNASKHGGAGKVAVVCDPTEAGGWSLRIANDGRPFDERTAPGPAEGHFGVEGMKERARRIGATLSYARKGKWTIVVLTHAPSS